MLPDGMKIDIGYGPMRYGKCASHSPKNNINIVMMPLID